jgi:quinol-cytochrome oxidoreductase complex cytochrome b subunit
LQGGTVALFTIEVVLILAVLFPPQIGREIDFSAQFSPRPEWYFLSGLLRRRIARREDCTGT